MVDLYVRKDDPSFIYAQKNALAEYKDSFVIVGMTTSPIFFLCNNTYSDLLDVSGARKDGYGVARLLTVPASEYSVMMFTKNTLHTLVGMDKSNVTGNEEQKQLKAMRDAIQEFVSDAVLDQSSQQSNDVVVDGRKISAFASDERNGSYVISSFITYDFNYDMAQYVSLPDSKFEGKVTNTIEERAAGMTQFNNKAKLDDVRKQAKTYLRDWLGFDSYTKTKLTGKQMKRTQEIESKMMSDQHIFQR